MAEQDSNNSPRKSNSLSTASPSLSKSNKKNFPPPSPPQSPRGSYLSSTGISPSAYEKILRKSTSLGSTPKCTTWKEFFELLYENRTSSEFVIWGKTAQFFMLCEVFREKENGSKATVENKKDSKDASDTMENR
jgi:hypothetical protein